MLDLEAAERKLFVARLNIYHVTEDLLKHDLFHGFDMYVIGVKLLNI